MMALSKPKLHSKFEVASLSCCRNIKGEPRTFRELPQTRGDFIMGLGKPQRFANFEGVGVIYYVNIREFVFKNWGKQNGDTPYY